MQANHPALPRARPENPTDVVARRITAFLIDALIGVVIMVSYSAATFTNTQLGSETEAELVCEFIERTTDDLCVQLGATVVVGESDDVGVVVLLWLFWASMATIVLPSITGWSIGKLLTDLRVVDDKTFDKAGLGANIGRGLLWVVDGFPYLFPLLGGLTMAGTKYHQRLGDRAAGTLVVRTRYVGNPPPSPTQPPPPTARPGVDAPMWDEARDTTSNGTRN